MRVGIVAIILGIVAVVLVGSSAYTVTEMDQVIITRFGKPMGDPVTEAGLHWKLPLF